MSSNPAYVKLHWMVIYFIVWALLYTMVFLIVVIAFAVPLVTLAPFWIPSNFKQTRRNNQDLTFNFKGIKEVD